MAPIENSIKEAKVVKAYHDLLVANDLMDTQTFLRIPQTLDFVKTAIANYKHEVPEDIQDALGFNVSDLEQKLKYK